jgi:hypothetical protein
MAYQVDEWIEAILNRSTPGIAEYAARFKRVFLVGFAARFPA